MDPQIVRFLSDRVAEFSSISKSRRKTLDALRVWIASRLEAKATPQLLFVCTHNSRRSQLAQAWARAAAWHYGLHDLKTHSGGTEVSELNIRALGALRRAGFAAAALKDGKNATWRLRFDRDTPPIDLFSKRLGHRGNPKKNFCAVMTCSDADSACPTVPGADLRLSLPHADPRHSDGGLDETETYDSCGAAIAREMAFVFARIDYSTVTPS